MFVSLGSESNLYRLQASRRRRWQRELSGAADVAAATGAGAAVGDSALQGAGRAIFIGVTTGVLVWTITRLLDRSFGLSGGRS